MITPRKSAVAAGDFARALRFQMAGLAASSADRVFLFASSGNVIVSEALEALADGRNGANAVQLPHDVH